MRTTRRCQSAVNRSGKQRGAKGWHPSIHPSIHCNRCPSHVLPCRLSRLPPLSPPERRPARGAGLLGLARCPPHVVTRPRASSNSHGVAALAFGEKTASASTRRLRETLRESNSLLLSARGGRVCSQRLPSGLVGRDRYRCRSPAYEEKGPGWGPRPTVSQFYFGTTD
ncbi:hypothetical protein BS50DRAFT_254054 [Corynespora cassiicola Philippines]|uniref:Uncharacterized protein n=1 Tax=Corynespora cassiicola Philippines TaxID=1448308 RepID=A0A2T2P4D1_CORCC|nr:hypothetical protein BS50DRAFT_254054 [Corynespora cassiicola Philippines]